MNHRFFRLFFVLFAVTLSSVFVFSQSLLRSGPRELEVNSPYRVPGTLVSDSHSFGILRFSGKRTERKVTMECWDQSGKMRWTHELKAAELKPPK